MTFNKTKIKWCKETNQREHFPKCKQHKLTWNKAEINLWLNFHALTFHCLLMEGGEGKTWQPAKRTSLFPVKLLKMNKCLTHALCWKLHYWDWQHTYYYIHLWAPKTKRFVSELKMCVWLLMKIRIR